MKKLLTRLQSTRLARTRKVFAIGLVLGLIGAASPASALVPPTECSDRPEAARWQSVVPRPAEAVREAGVWKAGGIVRVDWGSVGASERAELGDRLDRIWNPLGRSWRSSSAGADLVFASGGPTGEAYTLEISSHGVTVQASDPAGRFYALVTLAQLLPASAADEAVVARGTIQDAPRFSWRGLLVDSSRHLQSVATLERVLEWMALHKLNRFHWHLTDDQGWRLPVASWPKLVEKGAWRVEADGRRYGGAYSVADIRHLVAFAAARRIVVVPEVDVPGHASAALAAYPELSASGQPRSVPLDWGVADGVLAVGRASVTRFTNDVLATLVDLFPGPWIHWGGDEVYRNPFLRNAESQNWMRSVKASTPEEAIAAFWSDLARRTVAAGRTPIGWDEVTLHSPPTNTVVQWWDDPARASQALEAGYSLIASWKEATYLDYPEFASDSDRAVWMPLQPLERVANQPFWPPGTPERLRSQVLGVEAALFTERVTDAKLARKLFPRLALVADLAWASADRVAGWQDRLEQHRSRLEAWGVGMPPAGQ